MKTVEHPLIEWRGYGADRAALAEALADAVAEELKADQDRGGARLAVPGGTTPGPFLSALAKRPLDWPRIHVTLTDERQVPPDHERANARLLCETLLAGAPEARFAPLYDPYGAFSVAELLPFSVVILGMGTDGHTASLFPGADRLAQALSDKAPPSLALTAPGAPEARVSLSLPALLSARKIFLLITGVEKRATLEEALGYGPVEDMPVRAVLRGARSPVIAAYAD